MKLLVLLGVVSTVLGSATPVVPEIAELSKVCSSSMLRSNDLKFTGLKAEMVFEPSNQAFPTNDRYVFNLHLCSEGSLVSSSPYYLEKSLREKGHNSFFPFNRTITLKSEGSKQLDVKLVRNKRSSTMPFTASNLQDGSVGGVFLKSKHDFSSNQTKTVEWIPLAELFYDPSVAWVEHGENPFPSFHVPIYTGLLGWMGETTIDSQLNRGPLKYSPNWFDTVSSTEEYDFTTDERNLSEKVSETLGGTALKMLQKVYRASDKLLQHNIAIAKAEGKKQSTRQKIFDQIKGQLNSFTAKDSDVKSKDESLELESLVLAKLGPKKVFNEYSEAVQNAYSKLAFPEQMFNYKIIDKNELSKLIGAK